MGNVESGVNVQNGSSRTRRLLVNGALRVASRGVNAAVTLALVPLLLPYLGEARYGLWLTAVSIVAMLAPLDLGLSASVVNAISRAKGTGNRLVVRQTLSSATVILVALAALYSVGLALAAAVGDIGGLLNPPAELYQEANVVMLVVAASVAIALPFGVVQSLRMGEQEGMPVAIADMLTGLGLLFVACLTVTYGAGLLFLAATAAAVPVVVAAGHAAVCFCRSHREVRPAWIAVDRPMVVRLLRTGSMFCVLQVAASVAFATDNMVIAWSLGPEVVPSYAIPQRLFSLVPMALTIVLSPMWPAFSEAIAAGDVTWVRQVLRRALVLVVVVTVPAGAVLAWWGPELITLWSRGRVHAEPALLWGLAMWMTLQGVGITLSMFLNAAECLRLQLVCAMAMALVAFVLKMLLVQHIGVAGVVWATVIAYVPITLIPMLLILPRLLRGLPTKRVEP